MKDPYLYFFPQDWLSDPRLRLCNLEASGLWINLLMVMHSSPIRGVLLLPEGGIPDMGEIGVMIGRTVAEISAPLAALRKRGVFSVIGSDPETPDDSRPPEHAPSGAIYSRRMIRETIRSEIYRKNGQKRGKVAKPSIPVEANQEEVSSTNSSANCEANAGDGIGIGNGSPSGSQGEIQEGAAAPPKSRPDVEAVVQHYRSKWHPRSRPGEKERKKIRERLKEGYSVKDLTNAIDGNHFSAWHREHDQHALELCMRDSDHVTRFLRCFARGAEPIEGKVAHANRRAGQEWLALKQAQEDAGLPDVPLWSLDLSGKSKERTE